MNKTIAVILAGGRGDRLSILSEERAKPAVIFGGKYRIIDFTLSNCVHSGITRVALLTQYQPRSLNDHIGIGKSWDLDRMDGGVTLLQPYLGRQQGEWYKNTADAVYQNLHFVEESKAERVLILAGDHIYKMRYDDMVNYHVQKGAECTVGVVNVPLEEASRFGILALNENGAIVDFAEKPANPRSGTASMGIYLFNREMLIERLTEDAANPESSHDFGRDIIPSMIGRDKVFGYQFKDYWRDVGTVDAYWQANMELLADLPRLNLYDLENPVLTRNQNRPPVKSGPRAQVVRSLVSEGCIINGLVRNSVLSPGVYVEDGAVVEDSIVFDDCFVDSRAYVHRSILDKEVRVGREAQVGWGDNHVANRDEPTHLNTGITLVGKRAQVPPRIRVGRNCKLYPGVLEKDYAHDTIPSGSTLKRGGVLS